MGYVLPWPLEFLKGEGIKNWEIEKHLHTYPLPMEVCHPENQLNLITSNEFVLRWYSAPQETGEHFGSHKLTRGLREPKLVIYYQYSPYPAKKKKKS